MKSPRAFVEGDDVGAERPWHFRSHLKMARPCDENFKRHSYPDGSGPLQSLYKVQTLTEDLK